MARRIQRERHKHIFPIAAFILLAIGVVWFLNDLNLFSINIPWGPLVLMVIGIGIIVNRYYRRK